MGCARSAAPLPGRLGLRRRRGHALAAQVLGRALGRHRSARSRASSFRPSSSWRTRQRSQITPAQRDAILKEVERGQTEILHLQWELQGEKEKLVSVLDADKVDETKAKDQAANVMDFENRVKSAHLMMLVRVKNALTPAQQKTLRELRARPQSPKDGG